MVSTTMPDSVLVIGCNGQLGQSMQKVSREFPGLDCTFVDRAELDLVELGRIPEFLRKARPPLYRQLRGLYRRGQGRIRAGAG